MTELSEETGRDLLEAVDELRAELRRLGRAGVVVRLSPAERDLIARDVYERVDQRLAPAEQPADEPPRPHRPHRRKIF